MKLTKLFLAVFAGAAFFVSCSSDDNQTTDVPLGAYDNGVFVLNEGGSSPSSGTISFIGSNGELTNNIYTLENPGADVMGSFLQSMFMDDTRIFIVSGMANTVTVVDRYTFKLITTVKSNLENPRYGVIANGKAYVTNSANFNTGDDDYFTVIDLATYTTSKVALNRLSEKVIEEDGKLYITNGSFSNGSSVTVFNPSNNTTEKVIELGVSPNSIEEEDGVIYVLGGGKIFLISKTTGDVAATINLPSGFEQARNLTIEDDKIYYTNSSSVYVMDKNNAIPPASAIFNYQTTSQNGVMYGFAVKDDKIYISDGGNFVSDSFAYTYSLTGTLLKTYAVGVGPNGFYFND